MTEENNNSKSKKSIFYYIKKRIRISHIIILIVLLTANTYAWFIYVNTVSNSLDVHVRSWRIDFEDGNVPVTDYVNVYVDNVYPGMTTYNKDITAHNYSEVSATVSFKILEATIMGNRYVTREGRVEYGQAIAQSDLTSDQLLQNFSNSYPFVISFSVDNDTLQPQTGEATYTISVSWAYESGDDATDTWWGQRAYSFKQANPSLPCIQLVAKIYITQANS